MSAFADPRFRPGERVRFTDRWPDARKDEAPIVCGSYPGDLATVCRAERRKRGDYIVVEPDADRHGRRSHLVHADQIERVA